VKHFPHFYISFLPVCTSNGDNPTERKALPGIFKKVLQEYHAAALKYLPTLSNINQMFFSF
jgi:hypothetical protein